MTKLTLKEKTKALQDTVAMPEARDWYLNCSDQTRLFAVARELNDALLQTLNEGKSGAFSTIEGVSGTISNAIAPIAEKHQDVITNKYRFSSTIAMFFAVNYNPSFYNYILEKVILIKGYQAIS